MVAGNCPYKSRGGPKRIWHACRYSYDGLVAACRLEAAFRQLLLLAVVLIPVAALLPVGRIERMLLIGSVLLSLIIAASARDRPVEDTRFFTLTPFPLLFHVSRKTALRRSLRPIKT